jgi:hypothetical protein
MSEKTDATVLGCLGVIALICLSPLFSIWQAYVAATIWAWFLVGKFGYVLGVGQFFAFFQIGHMFKSYKPGAKDTKPDIMGPLGYMTLGPLFVLALAWCVKRMLGL